MELLFIAAFMAYGMYDQLKNDGKNWGGRKLTAAQQRITSRRAVLRGRRGVSWVKAVPARSFLGLVDAVWGVARSLRNGATEGIARGRVAYANRIAAKEAAAAEADSDGVKPTEISDSAPVENPTGDPTETPTQEPTVDPREDRLDGDPAAPTPEADSDGVKPPDEPTPFVPKIVPNEPDSTEPGTTEKETGMASDTANIEQVEIQLCELETRAQAKIEDAGADLARAQSDATVAENMIAFAQRVYAPPQYQNAMKLAAEGPIAAIMAAQATLTAAENTLAAIQEAKHQNALQRNVQEAAAPAGGVMSQEAYS